MQWNWLKEFRCLLISKLFDEALEKEVATVTDNFFKDIFGYCCKFYFIFFILLHKFQYHNKKTECNYAVFNKRIWIFKVQ